MSGKREDYKGAYRQYDRQNTNRRIFQRFPFWVARRLRDVGCRVLYFDNGGHLNFLDEQPLPIRPPLRLRLIVGFDDQFCFVARISINA